MTEWKMQDLGVSWTIGGIANSSGGLWVCGPGPTDGKWHISLDEQVHGGACIVAVPAYVAAALLRWEREREGGDRDAPLVDVLTAEDRATVERSRTRLEWGEARSGDAPDASDVKALLAIIDRLAPRAEEEE